MRAQPSTTGSDVAIAHVVHSLSDRGRSCGNWRPVELLGRGGTAEVWRAVTDDGREGALKILSPELRGRAGAAGLLRREHEVLAMTANRCPSIVKPLELVAGGVALVLEYLPGGDLVPLLGAAPRHWLGALKSVVAALTALSSEGLAHGDLKPRNVLFAADGGARVVDLTAARALDSPAGVTTAAYRVPVAVTAGEADAYALAALVYELATGRLPRGVDGTAALAEPDLAGAGADVVAAEELLSAALRVLRAGGRLRNGFSYLADVIESVEAVRP
jgi:serine/threonine protein kinase